jgi:tripartite ATP-independent transporter DctM subunit
VTILALGGVLMPVLMSARFSERASLGLLTGAGSLGLLFPPCLPVILYAIVAKIPIETMFLGGAIPGAVMVAMTAWWGVRQVPRGVESRSKLNWREAWDSLRAAKWELLIPVVALGGLFGGFATPVEAAALTALYAFIVETFVYRDLKLLRDVPRVMTECGLLVGGVLLILGVALGFTNYLIDAQVPTRGADWISGAIHSPIVFLLLLNLFLLVAGGTMEIYAAIVVIVPLIVPISEAFHIDPVHLGIIFLANMELGFLMPPAGLNLLISSYRFNKPMPEVCRAILPILAIQAVGVLLITYLPFLSTWLPNLFQ